jgi:hypothetical protein
MSRLNKADKKAIKLALHMAIDYEDAYIDAHRNLYVEDGITREGFQPEDRDMMAKAKHNVSEFTRVLAKLFLENPASVTLAKNLKTISFAELMRRTTSTFPNGDKNGKNSQDETS